MVPGYSAATWNTAPRKRDARLGWQPSIGYRESIERTLRWFHDNEPGLARVFPCRGLSGTAEATA